MFHLAVIRKFDVQKFSRIRYAVVPRCIVNIVHSLHRFDYMRSFVLQMSAQLLRSL